LAALTVLEEKANLARRQVLEMCARTGTGHIASSYSCTEILVALYYGGILRFDSSKPDWPERDRFILSKGHGGIALYPILAELGFFPISELETFCQPGGRLGSHPESRIPGVETVTGSLGHGLGIASGLALCAKMDGKDYSTFCLMGDGECYEGSVWEAAMFAASRNLNNLVAIIDRNQISATDLTENFLRLEPLSEKWQAFGWDTLTIDGHSFEAIINAFEYFQSRTSNKPLVIIANTVKCKGISFIEGKSDCHTWIPDSSQLELARGELGS
jgi:transketolase